MATKSFTTKKGRPFDITLDDGTVKSYNFYPVSIKRLVDLRDMAAGVARSVTSLLTTDPYKDYSRVVEADTGTGNTRTTTEPPPTDLLELRRRQRDADVNGIVNSLMAEENLRVMAGIVIDSLRDEYSPAERLDPALSIDHFLDDVDVPIFVQMLKGVMHANGKIFSPLADRLALLKKAASDKLDSLTKGEPEETPTKLRVNDGTESNPKKAEGSTSN